MLCGDKMKNTKSIKLNKDFKRLYYRGKTFAGSNIVIYASFNKKSYNRLGLTCGKAIGKAVKRNRVKRLMRESYRLLEDKMKPGIDLVIVARSRAVYAKCPKIERELSYALNKLGLLKTDEKYIDCSN